MKKNNELKISFKWSVPKSKGDKKVLMDALKLAQAQSTRNYTKHFANNIASYHLVQYVV